MTNKSNQDPFQQKLNIKTLIRVKFIRRTDVRDRLAAECLFSRYSFGIKRVRLEWESSLLHYHFCKGGCIFTRLLVCRLLVWLVYQQDNTKTTDRISRTLGWRVGLLTFGVDLHSQRTHYTVTCFF